MDNLLNELQETHVAAWNEKDKATRERLLRTVYSENIKMYDKDFILDGLQAISDFIEKLQTSDPEFHFSAAKPIEGLQDGARLFGHIRTSEIPLDSMDFFLLENGKVKHLYAFMSPAQ